MRTASEKKKRRGGRTKEVGVERHPCGKKRQPTPRQIRSTVIGQRMRHHGLTERQAERAEAGSVIGRLSLLGRADGLDVDQVAAARLIAEAKEAADRAILKPSQRSPSDFGGVGGFDGSDGADPDYAAWVGRVTKRWASIRRAILESGPLGMMAVEAMIFEDKMSSKLLGDLRLALNAVHRNQTTARA